MIRKFVIAIFLLCGVASAQPPHGGFPGGPGFDGPHDGFGPHGPRPGGDMHGMLPPGRWWKDAGTVKAIGLNDGQIQKIEQVFQESRMKLVDVHANLEKEELKLEPLLEAETPDENAVLSAIDRITSAHAALEKANAQMAFAIRRVLTPEQWKNLRALRPSQEHHPFPPPMCPPPEGPRGRIHHNAHPLAHHAHSQPTAPPAPEKDAAPETSK